MKIPDAFWPAFIPFVLALTAVLNAASVYLQSRVHAAITEVKQEVAVVKAATNGINSRLQERIAEQEMNRIHTAELTEKDKAIVEAEHSPQK